MSQLFYKKPNINILYNLLNKICNIENNYFIIDKDSFKRAEYYNILNSFCESLILYYHQSKQFYITRKLNYNNFLTIIRHLCNINNINITYITNYQKSKYNIIYKISKNILNF